VIFLIRKSVYITSLRRQWECEVSAAVQELPREPDTVALAAQLPQHFSGKWSKVDDPSTGQLAAALPPPQHYNTHIYIHMQRTRTPRHPVPSYMHKFYRFPETSCDSCDVSIAFAKGIGWISAPISTSISILTSICYLSLCLRLCLSLSTRTCLSLSRSILISAWKTHQKIIIKFSIYRNISKTSDQAICMPMLERNRALKKRIKKTILYSMCVFWYSLILSLADTDPTKSRLA